MTDEQIKLEKEKIVLLKRIADALDRAFPNLVLKSKDEIDKENIVSLKMDINSIYGCPSRLFSEDGQK